jgi:hypothetical protein
MDNGPLILGFEASIADLARSLQQLEGNMARLSELNGHFVSFNNSFGQMLQGLQLASSCYDYGEVSTASKLLLRMSEIGGNVNAFFKLALGAVA